MKRTVITVTNRKGGVGKSTEALHVAAGLATHGYNVALIDADSQGHQALMLDLPQSDALYRVMIESAPLAEELLVISPEVYSTPDNPARGNLYLLPGYERTYKIPNELQATDAFAFLDMVDNLTELAQLDFVVIDTQPTMSDMDGAIYLATDAFLFVTECEALAIAGLSDVIDQTQRFGKLRRRYLGAETRILGIVPNKMRTKTTVHQHNIGILGRHFGVFSEGGLVMAPKRLLTVWQQAANERKPIYVYEPTGEAAQDEWRIVNGLEGRINLWQAQETE